MADRDPHDHGAGNKDCSAGNGAEAYDASVVIPSYDNGPLLLACLDRLAEQTHPAARFEVVVVIDGSTDGTAALLADYRAVRPPPFALRVLEQPNQGRAAALNHGAGLARGHYLVIIDPDIQVNREFIAAHLQGHTRGDVVVGPIPLSERSPLSFVTDGVVTWADEHTRNLEASPHDVPYLEVYGGNYSMGRADYLRLGGNRPDLRRSEDHQLGRKLRDAGLRAVYAPQAIAAQIYDKTVHDLCRDFYVDGQSQVRLVEEFPEMRRSLLLGQYRPMSWTKRLVRPSIVHRRVLGAALLWILPGLLESARRRGLRWRVLGAVLGVLVDGLYFRGVHDAAGSDDRFSQLVQST